MKLRCYKEILEQDYRIMKQILLPSTLKKIIELKQTYIEKYLRHYVKSRYLKSTHDVKL